MAICLSVAFSSLSACRSDSGPNDYQSQEYIPDAAMPLMIALLEGEERLSLGIFYEGEFTEEVVIDDLTTHFYIYEETFSVISQESDRTEGVRSDLITHRGGPWWGGGVHWDEPRDLSEWTTLHLSLKSTSEAFSSLEVAMNNSDTAQAKVKLQDYGFIANGEWHSVEIPLSDLMDIGLDITQIAAPLVLIGSAGDAGERLLIDAVYLNRFK